MKPYSGKFVTDMAGVKIGHAHDVVLASGVTALTFDTPAIASIAIHGGAPGVRDTALLEPEMSVERVDALVLSGGSAFGLDAMGGVQAWLRGNDRGLTVRGQKVPIVPGAILFDLANGGTKAWGKRSPYWDLGFEAAANAGRDFALGTAGAGYGATTANLKGGLGCASATTSKGFRLFALVAVNAMGQATIGSGPYFWAAPFERDNEFGGLGLPSPMPSDALACRLKGDTQGGVFQENTTIAIVVTDAALTKAQAKRLAIMAQGGMARALRPAHAAMDGDVVFSASTGTAQLSPDTRDLTEIGMVAGDVLARAIACGIYHAKALPFSGALPDWQGLFGL